MLCFNREWFNFPEICNYSPNALTNENYGSINFKPWVFVPDSKSTDTPKKIYVQEIIVTRDNVFCRDGDLRNNLLTKIDELRLQKFVKIEFPHPRIN